MIIRWAFLPFLIYFLVGIFYFFQFMAFDVHEQLSLTDDENEFNQLMEPYFRCVFFVMCLH